MFFVFSFVLCCVCIENRVCYDRVVLTWVLVLFTEFAFRPKCNQFFFKKGKVIPFQARFGPEGG